MKLVIIYQLTSPSILDKVTHVLSRRDIANFLNVSVGEQDKGFLGKGSMDVDLVSFVYKYNGPVSSLNISYILWFFIILAHV